MTTRHITSPRWHLDKTHQKWTSHTQHSLLLIMTHHIGTEDCNRIARGDLRPLQHLRIFVRLIQLLLWSLVVKFICDMLCWRRFVRPRLNIVGEIVWGNHNDTILHPQFEMARVEHVGISDVTSMWHFNEHVSLHYIAFHSEIWLVGWYRIVVVIRRLVLQHVSNLMSWQHNLLTPYSGVKSVM